MTITSSPRIPGKFLTCWSITTLMLTWLGLITQHLTSAADSGFLSVWEGKKWRRYPKTCFPSPIDQGDEIGTNGESGDRFRPSNLESDGRNNLVVKAVPNWIGLLDHNCQANNRRTSSISGIILLLWCPQRPPCKSCRYSWSTSGFVSSLQLKSLCRLSSICSANIGGTEGKQKRNDDTVSTIQIHNVPIPTVVHWRTDIAQIFSTQSYHLPPHNQSTHSKFDDKVNRNR